MKPDPARLALSRALVEIEGRADAATNAILRSVCGGMGWHYDVTRKHRSELASALVDLDVVHRAIKALDQMDAECER